jgi:hypothetical protein
VEQPAQRRGIHLTVGGPQHPELELLPHVVEPILEVADLGRQPLVPQHESRVGQTHRDLGQVLHLHQHVDGAPDVGEVGVLGCLGRVVRWRAGHGPQPRNATGRSLQEHDVAGHEDLVAVDVGDPLAVPPDGHHCHARLGRKLDAGERPVVHVRPFAHADAVGHLVGRRQIGDEGTRDTEVPRDDARDVDGRVADALDGADHLQHRRHGVGIAR